LTTPIGFQMAEFPVHPMHSKALLTAESFGCVQEMLSIIAMLQVQHVFVTPSGSKGQADKAKLKFTCIEGDHITLLNVFKTFNNKLSKKQHKSLPHWCLNNYLNYKSLMRAVQIRAQLTTLLKKFKIECESTCQDRTEPILKCLTTAFFMNAAKSHYSGDYRHLKSDLVVKVHPSSVINLMLANLDDPAPKCVIYNDIVQSKTCYLMRDISVINATWLNELVPEYYDYGTERENLENKKQRLA
jgi:ATP-dependent RNA helicase DDX35